MPLSISATGESVVVVEAQSVSGAHTKTYTDLTTNATIDYGVIEIDNTSIIPSNLSRFNIPLTRLSNSAATSAFQEYFVDFGACAAQPSDIPSLILPARIYPTPCLQIPFGHFVKNY